MPDAQTTDSADERETAGQLDDATLARIATTAREVLVLLGYESRDVERAIASARSALAASSASIASPVPWLVDAAREHLDTWRRERQRFVPPPPPDDDAQLEARLERALRGDASPAEAVSRADEKLFAAALAALESPSATLIALDVGLGRPRDESCAILGLSAPARYDELKHEAFAALRQEMSRRTRRTAESRVGPSPMSTDERQQAMRDFNWLGRRRADLMQDSLG